MAAAVSGRFLALLVQGGTRVCALALSNVVETLRPLSTEGVPGLPDYVRGLAVIRGLPVPVVDLGLLMGEDGCEPCRRFVLLRVAERRFAVAVQAVYGLRRIEDSVAQALPPLLRHARPEALEAVGVLDRALLLVLEAGRMLPDEVWQRLDNERLVR